MWAPLSVLAQRLEFLSLNPNPRPTVLVLGSGWGAHAFVGALDHKQYRVQVLSPHGVRLNQPALIHNFPNFHDPPVTHFSPSVPQIQDKAVQLKEDSKTVQGHKGAYPYDYLVIATGSEAYDFKVKGVQEHCLLCKTDTDMKQIQVALKTKDAILMGAGPTGVELACKLNAEGVQVRILEATPTLLPGFSETMRQRVAAYLANREIPVQTGNPVQAITKDAIILKNGQIPYKSTLIWTCGIQPVPFVRQLTGGGPLTVDPFLCYKKGIYALGDSVKGWPPTAQNARQQGLWLAEHFNGGFKNTNAYQYHERGRVLDLTYAIFIEYGDIVWHIPYFLTPLVRWILQ
jgi:NADH dehydrogenase FAD-containing subunit